MTGLHLRIASPSISSINRSTPWVEGWAGPMLRIIRWSAMSPVGGSSGLPASTAASASLMRSTALVSSRRYTRSEGPRSVRPGPMGLVACSATSLIGLRVRP